ncbi:MAG: tRNA (guanosine(46)-N7)-methyltransferase TrmB [Acidobacteria bacterium]|nr:MAG: tRNA (guanosine(46)-N7)-methyltransferase TrmB [Acidobacteriota bacterium]GIU82086.1 MAG: tRNA (guanine-N(7)-)-methyltransferase [Pyrinomonadaceae bacterium]
MSRIRVHQHVNPLARHYLFISPPLNLKEIFANPDLPVHLDIGSARGRFLLSMAELDKETNFIGLEIRRVLVDEANRIARERNLTNLHYEFTNVLVSLKSLLQDFPENILKTITIHFPDPWFKKRHAKRRMITDENASILAFHLAKGGRIFLQTDVEFLAEEIAGKFREIKNLKEISITESPFPVKTEREKAVEAKGKPIYRFMFEKI